MLCQFWAGHMSSPGANPPARELARRGGQGARVADPGRNRVEELGAMGSTTHWLRSERGICPRRA